jgi:UDP-2,3-diacylglucosamine hydrolase
VTTAIIADSHLGGPGGEAGPLVEQIHGVAEQGCERLILLGDIFHIWVAKKRFETPEVRAVMAAVQEARRRGVRVEYVEGNRDFFVGTGPYAACFDRVALEVSFEAAGCRYLAVHGDGLNDRDTQYRWWRWLSKSLPVRLAMRLVPTRLAQRLVHSTEAKLAQTNFKHKRQVPEAVLRAYGEKRLAEGYDALLLGHFHEPHRWRVPGGEVRLLDAWFRSRRVEYF